MLAWLWGWVWELAWYAVLLSGWWCWWRAHRRADDLRRELTVMAQSWRYVTNKKG